MSWFKKPNDVWLRIWLIIAWYVMVIIEWAWVQPWLLSTFSPDYIMLFVVPFLFTVVVGVILLMMWEWLRKPDCKCWDDIKAEQPIDPIVLPLEPASSPVVHPSLIVHDCPDTDKSATATKLAGRRRPAVRKKKGGNI